MMFRKWQILIMVLSILLGLNFWCPKSGRADALQPLAINQIKQTLKLHHANALVLVNGKQADSPEIIQNRLVPGNSALAIHANRFFPIASLQKPLTGLLMIQAINNHQVKENSKLDRFFPNISKSRQITVSQLLTQTSGVVDLGDSSKVPLTNERAQLMYTLSHLKVTNYHQWHYANSNFTLLAAILMRLDHQSYNHLLQTKLIKPAQLSGQIESYQVVKRGQVVESMGLKNRSWPALTRSMSAGLGSCDFLATPNGYWKLLQNDLFGQPNILKTILKHRLPGNQENYFAGFYLKPTIMHADGAFDGYTATFFINYNTHQTLLIFCNNLNFQNFRAMSFELYRDYFGHEY
ncbi:serine hydrolase [Lactobacillus sp. 3B(2020)]|uniref:serine hydrolase domain-containing protein n=1 Tax=Lactobacillus sp. 3B(2020) TaxID=2695882 RepID=UPI0015DE9F09|nr:serine hydrolase [Lactobacillus sp. 3B(2020)]QLL70001.1 serine hydrolase [Lactobacillus sp. 3B(2020)]